MTDDEPKDTDYNTLPNGKNAFDEEFHQFDFLIWIGAGLLVLLGIGVGLLWAMVVAPNWAALN